MSKETLTVRYSEYCPNYQTFAFVMDSQQSIEATVQTLRERFLIECENNEHLYHELDVKRVRTDDWQIERFVINHNNEDKAYEALVKALQWKKSFGVHDRTDLYFPEEYYEFIDTYSYGRDKEGRLIQWEKNRNERNNSEFNLLSKQFIAHIMEKNDTSEHRKGFVIVTDTNGSGLSNINMETFKFKIEITEYYPEAMQANFIVDLPWLLNGVAKIIISFCDQKLKERVHFISSKDLPNFIDPELLPVELGGKREHSVEIPDGCLNLKQLSTKLGLSEKAIQTYYKSYGKKF